MRSSFNFNFHNNNIKIYNNINSKISFVSDLKNELSILNLKESSIDNNLLEKKREKRKSRKSYNSPKSINSKNKKKKSIQSCNSKKDMSKFNSKNNNMPTILLNSNPIHKNDVNSKIEKNNTLNLSNVNPEKKNFHSSIKSPMNRKNEKNIDSLLKPKKSQYLELQKQRNALFKSVISKTPKNNNFLRSNQIFQNFSNEYFKGIKNKKPAPRKAILLPKKELATFDYYKNDLKIMKINENIKNEIGSKELRKRLNLMKQSMINMSSGNMKDPELKKELSEIKEEIRIEENRNQKNSKIFENNNNNDESQLCLKNISKIMDNEENKNNTDIKNTTNKYRKIRRIKELYDSFDDEEYENENDNDFIISPNSYSIAVFDSILFFSSMYYLIFVPFFLSKNLIISSQNISFKLILIFVDFIYIIDLILNFFRPYQKFDETFIKKPKFIFIRYLKTWFFLDLIQCFPFFTYFRFLENFYMKKNSIEEIYGKNIINPILYLLILIKIIKVYKLFNKNLTIRKIKQRFSQSETIDNNGNILFSIFTLLSLLNLCTCIFIFLGRNSYPGWINKIDMQDESYINIYITAVYFTLVTITTVGYGDITGNSYTEISYQMFLLIIGTIAYSFIISYFSNYIVKTQQKSMTFQKNVLILEEIRVNNPTLKASTYKEVLRNLYNEQLYERNDKSLLFDSLPYSLKNKLIMEMYKPFIENFIFFKGTENSDFIVKVITSLKPLLSFKGDILVQEGDFINEIFFVKKGSLGLNITINKESPEESIKKYLGVNAQGKINISFIPSSLSSYKINSVSFFDENLQKFLKNKKEANKILSDESELKIREIKLLEIRDNEHFGVSLMFLNERSPLFVKVKTKIAELLLLKKMEAIEIHSIYPNIWKRINKKSLYNLEQIKIKIQAELFSIANTYGIISRKMFLKSSRNLNKFIKKSFVKRSKKKDKVKKNGKKNKNTELIEEKSKITNTISKIECSNVNKSEENYVFKNKGKFKEKDNRERDNESNNNTESNINNNNNKINNKDINNNKIIHNNKINHKDINSNKINHNNKKNNKDINNNKINHNKDINNNNINQNNKINNNDINNKDINNNNINQNNKINNKDINNNNINQNNKINNNDANNNNNANHKNKANNNDINSNNNKTNNNDINNNKINNNINNNNNEIKVKDYKANRNLTDIRCPIESDKASIVTLFHKKNSITTIEINNFSQTIDIDEIEFNNSLVDEGSSSSYNNQRVSSYKTNKNFKSIWLPSKNKNEDKIKNNKKLSNLKDEKEKNFISSFSNLSTTKEKSFYLSSSYENLNQITNNKYIKDNKLQSKTKLFLVKECSLVKDDLKQVQYGLRNSLNEKRSKKQNFKNIKNDFNLQLDKRSVNSLNAANLKSNREFNKFNDAESNLPKIEIEKSTEAKRQGSQKNPISNKQSLNCQESPVSRFKAKSPKRKKVNKKLDIISKNIKVANKNINNPEQFYKSFFNRIIKNETIDYSKKEIKNQKSVDKIKEKVKNSDSIGKQSIKKRKVNSMIYNENENENNQNQVKLKLLKKFEC